MYTYPPLCFRIRAIILSFIAFTSFLWTVLLSFYIFYQWEVMYKTERSLVVLLLLVNTITVVILLVLLVLPLRTWLDAARCMFLLMCHIGVAAAFAYWKPQFQCTATDKDKEVCNFTTTYIFIGSWIVPILIVLYIQGLSFMVYRMRKLDVDRGCCDRDIPTVEAYPTSATCEVRQISIENLTVSPPSPLTFNTKIHC